MNQPGVEGLRPTDPERVENYRLLGRLGEGGMGTVYLALAPTGRPVALKMVKAEFAIEEGFAARFHAEVENARRVASFCTAQVLDNGNTDDGLPYMVTEYIAGTPLSRQIAEHGALEPGTLHGVALGVAAALAAIHVAGLVHRDLKPANVILSMSGPRVIDFGIARALDSTHSFTRSGEVMGSPGWWAPEQVRGLGVTPAADIFAWGCLVAYAGNGRHPYGRGDMMTMATRLLTMPPDLGALPAPLNDLVRRATAMDPLQRPSAQDLLIALVGGGISAPAAAPVRTDPPTLIATDMLHESWQPPANVEPDSTQTLSALNAQAIRGLAEQAGAPAPAGDQASPAPAASGASSAVAPGASPAAGPAMTPTPPPASSAAPGPGPSASSGPAPSAAPAQDSSAEARTTPGQAPASGPNPTPASGPNPTPASGPAPGPVSHSGSTPVPETGPTPFPGAGPLPAPLRAESATSPSRPFAIPVTPAPAPSPGQVPTLPPSGSPLPPEPGPARAGTAPRRRWLFAALAVLAALAVTVAVLVGTRGGTGDGQGTQTGAGDVGRRIMAGSFAGDPQLIIPRAPECGLAGYRGATPERGRFCAVPWTLTNTGGEEVSLGRTPLSLVDDRGGVHAPVRVSTGPPAILPPGAKMDGVLVYDVPPARRAARLTGVVIEGGRQIEVRLS
ncbi:hypothetical protein GCM10010517_20890 [Streptosporangium fragile]|uniref:Protein kinase domain-containing protein n=1 Tax=Streptosporangium fragile TaxID=46186 RepID=A0ABP6IAB7_9ACTN